MGEEPVIENLSFPPDLELPEPTLGLAVFELDVR
jgi:hypothetical protein